MTQFTPFFSTEGPGNTVEPEEIRWHNIWELGGNPCVRAAITAQLYRYVRQIEHDHIRDKYFILTRGQTWLTPVYYDKRSAAQTELSLPLEPKYRIGPFWALDVVFDGISLRLVPPRFGQPGGGWELTTTRRIPFGERQPLL